MRIAVNANHFNAVIIGIVTKAHRILNIFLLPLRAFKYNGVVCFREHYYFNYFSLTRVFTMNDLLFARWFGLVSVILSLGILFNQEDAREMAKNMVKTETGYIMGAVLPVIFGSLSLMFANSLEVGWSLAVTLVGLSTLIIGTYRALFVNHWKKMMSKHIEQIPFLFSLFGLMLGVVLLYIGFFSHAFDYANSLK
jgi:hypothetical protein